MVEVRQYFLLVYQDFSVFNFPLHNFAVYVSILSWEKRNWLCGDFFFYQVWIQQLTSCTMYDDQVSQVTKGSLISSASSVYEVQDILGSGSYGAVTQCKKLTTGQIVAVKMTIDARCIETAKYEVQHALSLSVFLLYGDPVTHCIHIISLIMS